MLKLIKYPNKKIEKKVKLDSKDLESVYEFDYLKQNQEWYDRNMARDIEK